MHITYTHTNNNWLFEIISYMLLKVMEFNSERNFVTIPDIELDIVS